MKLTVCTLNAFAKTEHGGNPAGIVFDADDISEDQMLMIAKKVGFSETAFFQKSDKADFKVRFFTPAHEVDLCGHATVAGFYLLASRNVLAAGKYAQETKAGVLAIEIMNDGMVFMDQTLPVFSDMLDRSAVADSLNIQPESFVDVLPIQIVSTGLRDIFIPVKTLDALMGITPDLAKVREISREHNVTGYHLFTLDAEDGLTAHCRNFAPLFDIDEEAATGSASGAVSCYLFRHGRINEAGAKDITLEQGYSMNKPSEIKVKLSVADNDITRVRVGGIASDIREITVEI